VSALAQAVATVLQMCSRRRITCPRRHSTNIKWVPRFKLRPSTTKTVVSFRINPYSSRLNPPNRPLPNRPHLSLSRCPKCTSNTTTQVLLLLPKAVLESRGQHLRTATNPCLLSRLLHLPSSLKAKTLCRPTSLTSLNHPKLQPRALLKSLHRLALVPRSKCRHPRSMCRLQVFCQACRPRLNLRWSPLLRPLVPK